MKLATRKVLCELIKSDNNTTAMTALQILSGELTIDQAKKVSGDFMQTVLNGDIFEMLERADVKNRACLKTALQKFLEKI